ncbi:MAG: SMP-30/gluconolactonase/LRE family protein [Bryobacteraceae bacterium]|nr:SMP-30/gluconolactonase/LRE family protein [Bryobacteraceae bacterium]
MEKVASGFQFTEGPVFSRIGFLLFSDIPANRIMKYEDGTTSVFRENSGGANGLTFDHQGRLLACEGRAGRVTRTEKNGAITVLADRYDGKLLQAPNDLVYSIDGSVYFTDLAPRNAAPDPAKTGISAVYLITRKGELRVAAREATRPNGVALGPKQLTLYVADSAENNLRVYDVAGDGSLSNGRVVAECERPDGLKTDEAGNLYVAGAAGISVFSAEGKLLETIAVPEPPSNCNWGPGFRGLYITARTSVYFVAGKGPGTRTY